MSYSKEDFNIVPCKNGVGEWEISPIHETFDTREEAEKRLNFIEQQFLYYGFLKMPLSKRKVISLILRNKTNCEIYNIGCDV